MDTIRIITTAMLIASISCLAMSEQSGDSALETDRSVAEAKKTAKGVDLADFDPLDAKPAGVVKPRNHKPAPPKKIPLPPEGSKLVDRLCRITVDPSGWVLARFPYEKTRKPERPRWTLPNDTLEAMEALVAKNPKVMFRISGEMTIYENNSFILIRRVAIVEPLEETPVKPIPVKIVKTANTVKTVKTDTQPADGATTKPASQPGSADIMKSLLSEKNPTPVILPTRKTKVPAAKVKSVAPGAKGDIIQPATARLIVDRLMTIRPSGNARWREAAFEADNTLREPPVTLLPCTLLKYAENQPPERRQRVTGEVMTYKGKQYMLLRKVVIERQMNRL